MCVLCWTYSLFFVILLAEKATARKYIKIMSISAYYVDIKAVT